MKTLFEKAKVETDANEEEAFNPNKVEEKDVNSPQKLSKESYKKHTVWWRGNIFRCLDTELKFLNEHATSTQNRKQLLSKSMYNTSTTWRVAALVFVIAFLCEHRTILLRPTADANK